MTIDPTESGPPTIDLRSGTVTASSLPRLLVGVVIGLAAIGLVGWLFIGSVLGAPWYVAAPASVLFGAAVIAWHVAVTWRGYLVCAACTIAGLASLLSYRMG